MQSPFFFSFFFLTEIWFFYESYLQYAEYPIFPHCQLLHTVDEMLEIPFNEAPTHQSE